MFLLLMRGVVTVTVTLGRKLNAKDKLSLAVATTGS